MSTTKKNEVKTRKSIINIDDHLGIIVSNLNCVTYQINFKTFLPEIVLGDLKSITGYNKKDFASGKKKWPEIIHPDDLDYVKKEAEKLRRRKSYVADNEYRIISKYGEIKWIRDVAQKNVSGKKKLPVLYGVLIDITQSKIIDEELRESEERYKAFFNKNSIVTLIIDPDSFKILDANEAACKFYGWTHSQIIKMKVSEINTLSNDHLGKEINLAKENEKKQFFFKHRLANGSIRDVEISSGPILLKGKPVLYSTIKDITEKKLLEEKMLKMQLTLENARDTVFWIGPDAKILYVNKSACLLLEYTREELLELGIFDIDPLFHKEHWQSHWEKTKNLKSYKIESIHKTKGGKLIPVEISINYISFAGKEYHAAFGREITERKQSETILEKFKFMLDESQRIAHIGSWELDTATNEFTWSDETFRIMGVGDKFFTPTFQNFCELLENEERKKIISYFENSKETKIFKEFYFKIILSDHSLRWIHNTGKVYSDDRGNVIKMIGTVQDITEQKIIQQTLLDSQDKFSKAFLISPDSININRMEDGMYFEINNGFTNITGYTKEEALGKTSLELNIWANPEDRKRLIAALKSYGACNNLEAQFTKKDGTLFTGLMSARIIEINNEQCVLSITRDITERKAAEVELKESEERFHLMFENNGAAMLLIEPHTGNIIDANIAATNFYGYSHDALCSLNISDINVESDLRLKKNREEATVGAKNYFILHHRLASGEIKTVEAYSSPITVHGKTFIFGIIHDIDTRVKIETELRLRSAALEAAANAVVIADYAGTFLWANNSFCKLTGYNISEVIGNTSRMLKSGKQSDEFYKILWNTILSGNIWRGEIINKRKDGSLYTEDMTITPLRDGRGNIGHFIAIKQDITERKKFEKELIEAKEKAEVSEELKSAFLAQMSHEIRSPLYRILGYISLIKEVVENSNLETDNEVVEYFNSIDLSSQRLIKTIDSILNMSELQTQSYHPSFAKLELSELIEKLRKEYLLQAGLKMLDLTVSLFTKDTTVTCDEYSVTQIFANLIDNALKYTYTGNVNILLNRNDKNQLYIEVSDTGIGISNEFILHLFDPFTQEEMGYTRKFEGNGLGLALVKSYCDINNAFVEVKSEKGKGTTFRVTFN